MTLESCGIFCPEWSGIIRGSISKWILSRECEQRHCQNIVKDQQKMTIRIPISKSFLRISTGHWILYPWPQNMLREWKKMFCVVVNGKFVLFATLASILVSSWSGTFHLGSTMNYLKRVKDNKTQSAITHTARSFSQGIGSFFYVTSLWSQ